MTNREAAYAVLRDHANEWVSAAMLVEGGAGWRYSARVYDLRRDGHLIESRRSSKSAPWEFKLIIADVAPGQEALPWVA